jgi:hypothetical protein
MSHTKTIVPVMLAAYPPLLRDIFNLLTDAGARQFALFGGAIRDADHAARCNRQPKINDYDLRVWLSPVDHEDRRRDFIVRLATLPGKDITEMPSAGTQRLRYGLDYKGADLDISIRPAPDQSGAAEAVAIERAGDGDIGLCSVAVDPLMQAWATPEYEQDQRNKTLSVYLIEDAERREAYTTRMQGKFPDHRLVWL